MSSPKSQSYKSVVRKRAVSLVFLAFYTFAVISVVHILRSDESRDSMKLPATQVIAEGKKSIPYFDSAAKTSDGFLWKWFNEHLEGRVIFKNDYYFPVYEKYFNGYIDKDLVMLEIGVNSGGSIDMWKQYFGSGLRYIGVDISPWVHEKFHDPSAGIFIYTGSQENATFMKDLAKSIPQLDILIDDGGHTMIQQIFTLKTMIHKVKNGGVYLCEDIETSYIPNYGGGLKRKGTIIEFVKDLIDSQYSYLHKNSQLDRVKTPMWQLGSISFHTGIIVIEKEVRRSPPRALRKGNQKLNVYTGVIRKIDINKNLA